VAPRESAGVAEVTLSESDGVRHLHFGTEWVQGAMRIAHPLRLELEYQQQMMAPLLFTPEPAQILQLGLGAAALTKFCHRYLPASRIVAVELSARVIEVAREWFALPPEDARLRVVRAEAGHYLRERHAAGTADWLQVDLYDARARGPVLDGVSFYRDCRQGLRSGGVAAFNLFGGSMRSSLDRIRQAFGASWVRLPRSAAGNTVVLAFSGAMPAWDPVLLMRRARVLQRRFGFPAQQWLEGLRTASSRRWLASRPA
jgi:spermidine synthase